MCCSMVIIRLVPILGLLCGSVCIVTLLYPAAAPDPEIVLEEEDDGLDVPIGYSRLLYWQVPYQACLS